MDATVQTLRLTALDLVEAVINGLRQFLCGQFVDKRRARLCRNPRKHAWSCASPISADRDVDVAAASREPPWHKRSQSSGTFGSCPVSCAANGPRRPPASARIVSVVITINQPAALPRGLG